MATPRRKRNDLEVTRARYGVESANDKATEGPKPPDIHPGGPPEEYIASQREALETRDSNRNQMISDLISLRFHGEDTNPDVPEVYKKTTVVARSPILGDMVDRVTSSLTIDPWKTRLEHSGEDPKSKARDGRVEDITNRLFDVFSRRARRNVKRMMVDQICGTGRGVIKLSHRAEWWRRFPSVESLYEGRTPEQLVADGETEKLDEAYKAQDAYSKKFLPPYQWTDIDCRTYHGVNGPDGPTECVDRKSVV